MGDALSLLHSNIDLHIFFLFSSEPEVGISKFDNMFVCLKCGYKSNRKTNAIVHYKVKHLPQQTATCHICGKEFRNFVGRDRHRKEVHGISKAMMKQGEMIPIESNEQPFHDPNMQNIVYHNIE